MTQRIQDLDEQDAAKRVQAKLWHTYFLAKKTKYHRILDREASLERFIFESIMQGDDQLADLDLEFLESLEFQVSAQSSAGRSYLFGWVHQTSFEMRYARWQAREAKLQEDEFEAMLHHGTTFLDFWRKWFAREFLQHNDVKMEYRNGYLMRDVFRIAHLLYENVDLVWDQRQWDENGGEHGELLFELRVKLAEILLATTDVFEKRLVGDERDSDNATKDGSRREQTISDTERQNWLGWSQNIVSKLNDERHARVSLHDNARDYANMNVLQEEFSFYALVESIFLAVNDDSADRSAASAHAEHLSLISKGGG